MTMHLTKIKVYLIESRLVTLSTTAVHNVM